MLYNDCGKLKKEASVDPVTDQTSSLNGLGNVLYNVEISKMEYDTTDPCIYSYDVNDI